MRMALEKKRNPGEYSRYKFNKLNVRDKAVVAGEQWLKIKTNTLTRSDCPSFTPSGRLQGDTGPGLPPPRQRDQLHVPGETRPHPPRPHALRPPNRNAGDPSAQAPTRQHHSHRPPQAPARKRRAGGGAKLGGERSAPKS